MSWPTPVQIRSPAPVSPSGRYASTRASVPSGYASIALSPPIERFVVADSMPVTRPWSPNTMLWPAPAWTSSAPAPPTTRSLPPPVVMWSAPPKLSNVDHASSRPAGLVAQVGQVVAGERERRGPVEEAVVAEHDVVGVGGLVPSPSLAMIVSPRTATVAPVYEATVNVPPLMVSVAPSIALILPAIVPLRVITWPTVKPAAAHVPVPRVRVVVVAVRLPVSVIGALPPPKMMSAPVPVVMTSEAPVSPAVGR